MCECDIIMSLKKYLRSIHMKFSHTFRVEITVYGIN